MVGARSGTSVRQCDLPPRHVTGTVRCLDLRGNSGLKGVGSESRRAASLELHDAPRILQEPSDVLLKLRNERVRDTEHPDHVPDENSQVQPPPPPTPPLPLRPRYQPRA
jgi:hypothetical protein